MARPGTAEGGMIVGKRGWIVFYHDGREILRISKNGLHEGELQATIGLLAYERGISESDIEFAEVG